MSSHRSPSPKWRERLIRSVCATAGLALVALTVIVPALASARPIVHGLSTHRGVYWGGRSVTVTGTNFTGVTDVRFGSHSAWSVKVVSPTKIVAVAPNHSYGQVYVRVVTAAGRSSKSSAGEFTYIRPTMNDPIQGGLTGHQEQRISAQVRRHHHNVHVAHRSQHWTPAMGLSALRRARSWLGVPYSWAGGNGSGPTTGVCAHNGGDMDCRIVGFDCSGLTLYAWWPYEHLVHYAATQHRQAGRFHPTIGELAPGDLVFFSGYIADGIGHTAIYAGHGQVIEAPQSGERVTRARLVDVIADTGVYRGATRPMTHGRQAPGPQITSVTRTMKVSGGNIVVKGRNLGGVTSARVAGRTEYWFAHRSAHRLVLKAPAHHAGRVNVSVSNSWGTAHRTLTYVAPPKLTSLTPSSVSTAGGTTITLRGTGFTGITTATVGTRRVRPHVLSATRATVAVPAHAAGTVTVTVASAYGVSDGLSLTYVAPAPSSARRAHTATPAPSSSASSGAGSSSAPPGTPTDSPVSSPSSGSPTPTVSASTSPTSPSVTPTPSAATPTG